MNRTRILVALAILLVFVGVGVWLSRTSAPAREQHFPDIGVGLHLNTLQQPLPQPYNSNPPTSGWHLGSATAPWGILHQPFDDRLTVHNLEHGGVIIHYRQSLDPASVAQLTALAEGLQRRSPCIILVPRLDAQLERPIAVTAWTALLTLDRVDEAAITSFFERYVGHGPESICEPLS